MRQALELALEALQVATTPLAKDRQEVLRAITAIKEALAQPEQPKVRTGDCLLVGVCASEGHKIQVKQEPWRESASDYERGVIDGRQMQAQSSVDKAVNRMAQPEQEPVAWEQFYPDIGKPQLEQLPQLSQEVVLQYPKEAVDWQKQQKEYAQQLKVEGPCHVVCQCDKCKAQEQDNAYIYASNLAKTIWQKHYIKESPKFALLDTTEGVLTQIDNMTCGLVREKPAQPEQEPIAWMNDSTPSGIFARHMEGAKNFGCTIPLYTTPPQRTWVGLTDEEIADCAEKMEASDPTDSFWREFFRGIEAKLKDKNERISP